MKKLVVIPLVVLLFCMVSCSSNRDKIDDSSNSALETNETASEEERRYYKLGDTVSTDLFEFTLDEAKLAIALNNSIDENFFTPKEYDAQDDKNNIFVAPKGHTYAAVTYTITNLDRASTNSNGNGFGIFVEYDGQTYLGIENGAYFLYQDDCFMDVNGKMQIESSGKWYRKRSSNYILDPGEKRGLRAYIDIGVNVANLNDGFKLIVQLPNSSGEKQEFTYMLTE